MSRFSILVGIVLLVASCAVSGIKYGQNSIKLKDGEIIYFIEKGLSNSDKLLLAFQGSGCNSIASDSFIENVRSSFKSFDRIFIEKPGINHSLNYDSNPEREDCPQLYLENDNPEKRTADALVVIQAVQSINQYNNIVVLGGSEGGLISILVAAKSDQVNAAVTINGGGALFINDVLHNIRVTSPPEKLEEDLVGFKGFASHIASSHSSQLVVSNHGFSWWKSVLSLDQSESLKEIEVPVLVIQADKDESVSPAHTVEMVKKLQGLGHENIELLTYPNLNHGLTAADDKSHVDEVLEDAKNWLNRVLPTKP